MTAPFRVEVDQLAGGVHAVRVTGELDQATADDLRQPLQRVIDSGVRAVLIDLTDCEFIDSTGLGVLVRAREQVMNEDGGRRVFGVCCPNSQVRRLLEITGIAAAIGLHETRDDAVAALS